MWILKAICWWRRGLLGIKGIQIIESIRQIARRESKGGIQSSQRARRESKGGIQSIESVAKEQEGNQREGFKVAKEQEGE